MSNRGMFSLSVGNPRRGLSWMAVVAGLAAALAMAAAARPQEIPITVQLTSPLNAGSTHKGDQVTVKVASPDSFKGDTIQGKVTQASSSRGQSLVQITFDTLTHGGVDVAVAASIQGISNSKGQQGVDEQGQAVHASSIAAKQPSRELGGRGGFGGLIGGTAGEAADDTANAAGNLKTAGTPPAIQIAAQGPNLQLGPGATFVLSVKSNSSTDLASLSPSVPTAAAPSSASASANAPPAAASAQPVAAAADAGGGQPELKATKIEFVSGERTIFFDDFSDMTRDEPPPHWKVRDGEVELRTRGGIRELYAKDGVHLTSPTFAIPMNFTFELEWTGGGEMTWHFRGKDEKEVLTVMVRGEEDGKTASTTIDGPDGQLGHGMIEADTNKPVEFAVWAQQGRVRAYLNGQRVVDTNQVTFGPMDHLYVDDAGYRPNGIRQIRIAESAPDFSTVINATGKYVTHGINFDTDSDRLKPESGAVLKQIVAGLTKNPNLKLEIDGYTDSIGNDAHNLDLSKRRAQAVQTVLVMQFGIDAGRLTSNGFGAAKPTGSNDTPQGRAENRRVEFLKK